MNSARRSLRIALITGQLGLGGSEQQLYYSLRGLDRSRFSPMVISLGPHPDEYWSEPIKELGIPLWHLRRSLGRAGRLLQITRILRSQNIELVHSWVFHANIYAAAAGRLAGVPLRLGSMREQYIGLPRDRFIRWAGYRGIDALITNSAVVAADVKERRLTGAPINVVPNGVDVPPLAGALETRRLKAELGFKETDFLIGSIGRIDSNKNHLMLLRSFAVLADKWPTLRLVIIGNGPLQPTLVQVAEQLGIASRVSLPGTLPRAARFLPAMDICCLTSYTEGLPNLLMEAAAAGLPVVSTNCGGSVELIDDGLTGFLVSCDDVANMARFIDVLLTNPDQRRRMGLAARQKMCRQASIHQMATFLMTAYDETLRANG